MTTPPGVPVMPARASMTSSEVMRLLRGRGRVKPVDGLNNTERLYLTFLEGRKDRGEILWFRPFPFTVKLAKDLHYRVDFAFMEAVTCEVVIVDVKGRTRNKTTGLSEPYVEDDALVKIKAAAAMFPFRFILTWPLAGGIGWGIREIEP